MSPFAQSGFPDSTAEQLVEQYFSALSDLPPELKLVALLAFALLVGFLVWISRKGKTEGKDQRLSSRQRFLLIRMSALMVFGLFLLLLVMYEIPRLATGNRESVEQCDEPTFGDFHAIWSRAATRTALGCPREREETLFWGYQPLESGHLFWQQETRRIYVLHGDRTWFSAVDAWTEGSPDHTCVPAGYTEDDARLPRRGFGKVWCEDERVRALGAALERETGVTMTHQVFADGVMIDTRDLDRDLGIVVLDSQAETWQRHN